MKTIFQTPSRFSRGRPSGFGGIADAALIDVGDPSSIAADMDIRLGHVPFVALAPGMLCLNKGHEGVSVESGTTVEYVKVGRNDGIELCDIVRARRSEYCAYCVYDLSLLGSEKSVLTFHGTGVCRKEYCEDDSGQRVAASRRHKKTALLFRLLL